MGEDSASVSHIGSHLLVAWACAANKTQFSEYRDQWHPKRYTTTRDALAVG